MLCVDAIRVVAVLPLFQLRRHFQPQAGRVWSNVWRRSGYAASLLSSVTTVVLWLSK